MGYLERRFRKQSHNIGSYYLFVRFLTYVIASLTVSQSATMLGAMTLSRR